MTKRRSRRTHSLKGISPVVSSLLVAGIVIAAGSLLYTWWWFYTSKWTSDLSSMVTEEAVASSQHLIALCAKKVNDNTIKVLVATGLTEVKVESIYADNTLASYEPNALQPLKVTEITVRITSSSDFFKDKTFTVIRIVYEGGVFLGNFSIA